MLVFGIACFALLDPRKFAFTGMILMFLGIIGWMGLMGYAYWLWLPKVKRKKDFALDEEIDIRCDDLVNKVHGALMREQEKRYNREKREEADWDARMPALDKLKELIDHAATDRDAQMRPKFIKSGNWQLSWIPDKVSGPILVLCALSGSR